MLVELVIEKKENASTTRYDVAWHAASGDGPQWAANVRAAAAWSTASHDDAAAAWCHDNVVAATAYGVSAAAHGSSAWRSVLDSWPCTAACRQ